MKRDEIFIFLHFWSNEKKYLKVCIRNTGYVIATLPGSQNLRLESKPQTEY